MGWAGATFARAAARARHPLAAGGGADGGLPLAGRACTDAVPAGASGAVPGAAGVPAGDLRHAEILEPIARLGRGLALGVLIQIGLVGLRGVGIARLLPVALIVKLLESRLRLRA